MHHIVSELCNELLGTYFDEYYLSDAERKKNEEKN